MMRDTIPADELLSKAHAIGQYYGFTPLSNLTLKARGSAKKERPGYPEALTNVKLDHASDTIVRFLKQFQNVEHIPSARQPLFVWHTNIAPGRAAQKRATIQFHALGADRAIADAVIIRASIALARDLYHTEPVVRINSMGDKETRARYARELGIFFKKHIDEIPQDCTDCAKDDILAAAALMIERECSDNLPNPTEHLSDISRKRFEDLLEYLEMTETPYELARNLLSRGTIWNDMCFELTVGGRRVAWGSRYGDLTKHFFPTSAFSATGVVFHLASNGPIVKKPPTPKLRFHFVHIGDEAKRQSIRLTEEFKKARVPLSQHIGVESLTEQLRLADSIDSPYLLIMGRKEALDGSAILRNRATQVESTLPISDIISRLKAVA